MDKKNYDNFLILVKTNISIDKLTKPFITKCKKSELNKLKWLYLSDCKINEDSYLIVNLNEITFSVIKKLKKNQWIFSHKYILKDKFHNKNYKVTSSEQGSAKYKLLNTISHCKLLNDNIYVETNLWNELNLEKQEILQNFLINLKKSRKRDFSILNNILIDFEESKIAYQISEQANSYKKHFNLLNLANQIFSCSGGLLNIVDFNMENNNINFVVKDNSLIDKRKISQLEIIKKIKFDDDNLVSLSLIQDPEATYEIMQKLIRNKFN